MRAAVALALVAVLLPSGIAAQRSRQNSTPRITQQQARRAAIAGVRDTLKAQPSCWPGVAASTLAARSMLIDAKADLYRVHVTSSRAKDQVQVSVGLHSGSVVDMTACPWGAGAAPDSAAKPRPASKGRSRR